MTSEPASICTNPDHPMRPAIAVVSWPDGRFKPHLACKRCLKDTLRWYVIPGSQLVEGPFMVVISPLAVP